MKPISVTAPQACSASQGLTPIASGVAGRLGTRDGVPAGAAADKHQLFASRVAVVVMGGRQAFVCSRVNVFAISNARTIETIRAAAYKTKDNNAG